jgi:V/A-type H+-transporting ATPase subunit D
MGSLALNKSVLKRERDRLQRFGRFLPALELKRRQVIAELNRARRELAAGYEERDQLLARLDNLMALLGASGLDLSELVRIESVQIKEQNVVGVRLPVAESIELRVAEYSTLARPFWVDRLADALKEMVSLDVQQQVKQERAKRLERAVRRITQRVNLFEKVLVPTTRRNIQRISVYLADAERAAVVRSKIAKAKDQRAQAH